MYYYLKSPQAMEFIKAHLRGTTQLYVPLATLREMPVPVPDEEEMNKIVAILRTLDDKIQCSIKINDNLEQQAQAIFKEWFIENPENNEWSTGTFSELIKTTLNGDWGKEAPTGNNTEKVYCIRGADIPEVKAGNKGKMPTRYILPKNFVKKQLTAGDIVVEISGGSPTQSTLFPELEHQMAYIKSNYANTQKPMVDRFVKTEVPITSTREVRDSDVSDDKVDEIIREALHNAVHPEIFDDCYVAIQKNLMPDWYRKEIGLSKVRLALTDTLDNGTPMGRAVAKRAAHSIVTKIVNAIAQESNTATSDNS